MSHTKGPWINLVEKIVRFDQQTGERIEKTDIWITAEKHHIALVCSFGADDETKKRNASILAAAPEMLEVLQKIEKTLTEKHLGVENHTYELMLISDLIKKAKGEL